MSGSAIKKASDAQKSAIDALQKFYSIIVAAAFTGGVLKFLEQFTFSAWSIEQSTKLILLVAFVVTIVPFYHGMERHLFETHIAGRDIDRTAGGRPSPILVDVFAFMIEGAILFTMGRSLDNPSAFLKIWSALLIVDIIWSLIVWRYQKSTKPIWVRNNFIWLVIAWIVFLGSPWIVENLGLPAPYLQFTAASLIGCAEVLRSIFDYKSHWDFYFPDDRARQFVPQKITYLACPYTSGTDKVRLARFNAVTDVSAALIRDKEIIFSPITMTHPFDQALADPGKTLGSDYWVAFDEAFMAACGAIKVLKLPGWETSSGVTRELAHFRAAGIEPEFLDPANFGIDANNPKYADAFTV